MNDNDRELLELINDRLDHVEDQVDALNDFAFGDDDAINTRAAIDDIRLMRQIWHRFKSARFILGTIMGILTFIGTIGYGIYKLIELITNFLKMKGGG